MDIEDILDLLGEDAKKTAFSQNLERVRSSPRINLDALRICIKILPKTYQSRALVPDEQLWDILQTRILAEDDPGHLLEVAKICLSNPLAATELHARLWDLLNRFLDALSFKKDVPEELHSEAELTAGVLRFLKCTYWLPPHYHHLIERDSIALISKFMGIEELDHLALDTLSALLSLLKRGGRIVLAPPKGSSSETTTSCILQDSIVDESIFERITQLPKDYTLSMSSKIFGVWFQWISQAVMDEVGIDCIYHETYWEKVRTGLLIGYGDQRKYCLGIIEQSLQLARKDIDTPTMKFRHETQYLFAYKKYASLFEMIVLNRYAGQVEASLPELTALLGSDSRITPSLATTLIAAAINSKVQEGIRKLVGNWYMKYVIEIDQDLTGHMEFFLGAFLDWATDGSLFTSTLVTFREETSCTHGEALVAVVARFVSSILSDSKMGSTDNESRHDRLENGRKIVMGMIRHISSTGGKIFRSALLYLLEGLVHGLELAPTKLQCAMTQDELTEIISLSRFSGLPEISNDLLGHYCKELCMKLRPDVGALNLPGFARLDTKSEKLSEAVDTVVSPTNVRENDASLSQLREFITELDDTKHASIQGEAYAFACKRLKTFLEHAAAEVIDSVDLSIALQALWEEAERREFSRPVVMHLPPLLFHPTCVRICLQQQSSTETPEVELTGLLSKTLSRLQRLSQSRSYVLCVLVKSVRRAIYSNPSILSVLPFEGFFLDYLNNPPAIKSDFLFEVIAAQKLTQSLPHRTYASYYGAREWHAYASFIDILNRFPEAQLDVAKRILDCLLQPWKTQKSPVLIKSPWKDTFQLQAMLLLSDWCFSESEADIYLESFMSALVLEPWPRYRFLLEWIIARLYIRFPGRTARILKDLERLDLYTPVHIASLMKLGLLVASQESEDFMVKLATQLNCLSASPKVHIRHEANYVFPLLVGLARSKGWEKLTNNPALMALDSFIRSSEKFKAAPWTIRTLRLNPTEDFNLVKIFQGQFLTIESPEKEKVACEDFISLQEEDREHSAEFPPSRVSIGEAVSRETDYSPTTTISKKSREDLSLVTPSAFLQTKAGFDLNALQPTSGPPSRQNARPASVILIASLIDNPTNLGGLSRISESFGLEALYVDDLKKTSHKDFKATSVTSEKHLPIRQLKVANVPEFLVQSKAEGYEVVGIEQTDRSGILGEEPRVGSAAGVDGKSVGTLPQKCILVLGSEKEGIAAEVLAVLDRAVEIKTVGVTRSLNVQTAGGIAVYEWWREWGAKL